jgi:hypothetical protein
MSPELRVLVCFAGSAGQAVSNISAKVDLIAETAIGETALPPQMIFALRNAQHRVVARGAMSPTREVTFADVVPGNYEVLAGSESRAYSVVSIIVNGSRVSGHSFTVPAGTTLALSLSVVRGTADVSGVAQQDGKGAAGAMIVLVPKNPGGEPRTLPPGSGRPRRNLHFPQCDSRRVHGNSHRERLGTGLVETRRYLALRCSRTETRGRQLSNRSSAFKPGLKFSRND